MKTIFKITDEFEITIPKDFQFRTFVKKHEKDFLHGINGYIKEKNWNPSQELIPGKKIVKVAKLIKSASSQECVDFVKANDGILPNRDGLAVIWQEARVRLPMGLTIVLDEKNVLSRGYFGGRLVSCLCRTSKGWGFGWHYWVAVWGAGDCLVFLCDLPLGQAGK